MTKMVQKSPLTEEHVSPIQHAVAATFLQQVSRYKIGTNANIMAIWLIDIAALLDPVIENIATLPSPGCLIWEIQVFAVKWTHYVRVLHDTFLATLWY